MVPSTVPPAPVGAKPPPALAEPARPATVADLAVLRSHLTQARRALEDLLWAAGDQASGKPVTTPEALRLDIDRHGADVRHHLVGATSEVEALSTLLHLAAHQRRQLRKGGAR